MDSFSDVPSFSVSISNFLSEFQWLIRPVCFCLLLSQGAIVMSDVLRYNAMTSSAAVSIMLQLEKAVDEEELLIWKTLYINISMILYLMIVYAVYVYVTYPIFHQCNYDFVILLFLLQFIIYDQWYVTKPAIKPLRKNINFPPSDSAAPSVLGWESLHDAWLFEPSTAQVGTRKTRCALGFVTTRWGLLKGIPRVQ